MNANTNTACVVGGGVIGGGWAARFLLNGWNVHMFDPDPRAQGKIEQVLANARRVLPLLSDVELPAEGQLVWFEDLARAVADAAWIQESVPENLELKHKVMREIQAHADSTAIVASSTSGFTPTQLRQGAIAAGQIIVAHPFNPVYLLPLVELVAGEAAHVEVVSRAAETISLIGMKPLIVRKEIDAHIADRLLEAVWREALWLINDDIATTAEIDDAIRFGFGLRWAQMGLFETYRLAGGEGGMAHFVRQFGPALAWPWTKLMDVPELNEELVNKIASQSDAQSGDYSIRELERIRDDNLVDILRAQKSRRWGAGKVLAEHDELVRNSMPVTQRADIHATPLQLLRASVLPSWIDYNGHMTEYRYLQVFADSSDCLLQYLGANADYVASGFSFYTVETHLIHLDECKVGEQLYTTTQILHADEKRLHIFQQIFSTSDDRVLASGEQMLLHVDMALGKVVAATGEVARSLLELCAAHAQMPRPDSCGRHVGQR